MNYGVRIAQIAALMVLFSLLLLKGHLQDLEKQYAHGHMEDWLHRQKPNFIQGQAIFTAKTEEATGSKSKSCPPRVDGTKI
ncbi:hypothetical protein N7490_007311 [Penicillium lividum]|nr:hypothetical protein N7490_007311 [Penicillium lividum]